MIKKTIKENKNEKGFAHFRLGAIIFLTTITLGLPFSLLTAYSLAFYRRVYPRTFVCQIPMTGKDEAEAALTLSSYLKNQAPVKITLNFQKESFSLDPNLITYLSQNTAKNALKTGREKILALNLKRLIKLAKDGENLAFDFQLDNKLLDDKIASISAKLYIPAIDPEIKVIKTSAGKKVVVETGKNGQEVDLRTLKKNLMENFSCPQKEIVLAIPISSISPKISEEMAEVSRNRTSALLDKEVKLLLGDRDWTVPDEEIVSFVSFTDGFNQEKIENFADELAKTINAPPENASFRFENDRVSIFKPSKDGITLKQAEFVDNFEKKLISLEQTKESQQMEIPVLETPAKVSTGDANSLGIKELLGKGSSLFLGSISERIHNINLASLRLSGILIAPDEDFSFNRSLGDVSENTGFKQAYIIKQGRTVLGDGGGVCQVSTTLFRAAIAAGLPILERHAHAYRVHYYEEDLGPGFDATVFDPNADLKFKNNTQNYILIQSAVNLKKKALVFELFGTSDGRKTEIGKARVWDKVPPPPDLYQDDPTLPAGVVKQVDWKAWGAKAAFDYKVTQDGEIIFEKTFTSVYKPWQAVFLRGTGR